MGTRNKLPEVIQDLIEGLDEFAKFESAYLWESEILAESLGDNWDAAGMKEMLDILARAIDGAMPVVEHILKNVERASTLRASTTDGPKPFTVAHPLAGKQRRVMNDVVERLGLPERRLLQALAPLKANAQHHQDMQQLYAVIVEHNVTVVRALRDLQDRLAGLIPSGGWTDSFRNYKKADIAEAKIRGVNPDI